MRKQLLQAIKTALGFAALVFIIDAQCVLAQAPNKMSYQAVIRTPSNALVMNQNVGMRISILQGSASGTAVYVETHAAITNANGLVSIQIGGGTVVSGVFANIPWGNGSFFLKAETDPTGGTNYTISATSELLGVPFAIHANNGVPEGALEGQILTMCSGVLKWTNGGECYPYPSGTVHCSPASQTQVVPVTNPVTGKTWMDRNLGAGQVATSTTDNLSYGDLYQWGRFADGHQCRTSATLFSVSTTDQPNHEFFITVGSGVLFWGTTNDNLWQGQNGVNNPCPNGFRLPTMAELDAERISWSSSNNLGAFSSTLKLTPAGFRDRANGNLLSVNSWGYYWSSTVWGTNAVSLVFNSSGSTISSTDRRPNGLSIRCIKN